MTENDKDLVEIKVRVKFLEKVVYGLIAFVALQLVGLFILWAKQVIIDK